MSTCGSISEALDAYGLAHEAELWDEFSGGMDDRDLAGWLYDGGAARPDRPADLGYFVGRRIAEAWWERHGDDDDALERVLSAHCDAGTFLAESGYR